MLFLLYCKECDEKMMHKLIESRPNFTRWRCIHCKTTRTNTTVARYKRKRWPKNQLRLRGF